MPIQVSQFSDASIPLGQAASLCGPAAAIAFARANGRTPSLREAMELAKLVGWTAEAGMAGPASQKALLAKLGIDAELTPTADEKRMAAEVANKRPVTISTAHHYFTASDFDPSNRKFYVGASGTDAGGPEWMSLDEMDAMSRRKAGGGINGAIYMGQSEPHFTEANTQLPTQTAEPEAPSPPAPDNLNDGAIQAAVRTAWKGQEDVSRTAQAEATQKPKTPEPVVDPNEAIGMAWLQQLAAPQPRPKLFSLPAPQIPRFAAPGGW